MHKSYTVILIITFLVSCSSENTKQIEANSLIEPNYEFSAEFFECKLIPSITFVGELSPPIASMAIIIGLIIITNLGI